MPAVKEAFGVTTGMAQLTLSLGMLSMAFFTIAYGGLSDRFGRKRVLLSGLVLFTCGAATCMIAANMAMLLAGRILQGAGAGCGVVLARAIARDVYGKDNVAQVIAYLTAAYVLGPMLAPPLGGHLTVLFGWRALFVFASAVGLVVILAVAFAVPETRARNVAAPRGVFAGYKSLLRRLFPRRFPGKEHGLAEPAEVESVVGAFLLTRKRLWDTLGGLDERFTCYTIATKDLQYRLIRANYRLAQASVSHRYPCLVSPVRETNLQRRAARRLALFRRRLDGCALHPRNLRRPRSRPRHALRSSRRDGGRHRTCRLGRGRGGVLAVLLAGRAAAAHRAARGRYLGADGDGALRRNDCSTARRLDGGAGQGLAFKS